MKNLKKSYVKIQILKFQPEEIFVKKLCSFLGRTYLSQAKEILDLGSGCGFPAIGLKKIGKKVIGVDYDAASKKYLSKYGINVKILDIEKEKFPFEKNTFDAVTCFFLIEHLSSPENLMCEIKRVLKSDGILIITTPNYRFFYKYFYHDYTHVKPYDHESIKQLLSLYDFQIIDIKKRWFLPFFWRIHEKFFKFPNFFPSFLFPMQSNHLFVVAKNLKGKK